MIYVLSGLRFVIVPTIVIQISNNSDIMNVICYYGEKLSEANSIKIYTCEEMTEVFLSLVRLVVITINYY